MKPLTTTSCFPKRYSAIILSVLFFLSVFIFPLRSAQAADCRPWLAKLISLEGEASTRSTDDALWQTVEINTTFCPGDSLQVGTNSRLTLRLSDHSLLRLDAQTTVTFMPPKEEGGFWMTLLKGIGHFMSRVPRTLNIKTPVADAKIEGTEFLIRASADEMFVTVFEGTVLTQNDAGELRLKQGQSAVVNRGSAPILEALVRPRDAVQWALYYPPVLQFNAKAFEALGANVSSRIAESMDYLKQGDRKKALEHLDEISAQINDTRFLLYRASLRMALGRVSEAMDDLDGALILKPENGDVLALKALVAVVQNDQTSAITYADKAIKAAPNAVGPLLVRSYVLQAGFKLKAAREIMETTVMQSPDNALAWSRLAELRLMFRDLDGALAAAERAVEIDPGLAKTQTVLGFSHLIRIEIDAAKTAFEKAIAMDQGAPMPRLGLGLAKIREGDLEDGRREIETAAMLNPSHALIRSYLGKAYYEEKRDGLAVEQYEMARELDPLDPTPDLYSAILNQTSNKPVSALEDIERSITLNENRAVYRSRLLLDEDLAARSASLGRIYQDLGFQQRALVAGWRSVTLDPGNYSGHRLLADSYASLPRHQIARVSELLQSQLLQPLNMTAIQPQLAETNLAILQGAGPSDLSFNEFNPLFVRNNTSLQINGVTGSNDTWGNDLVVSTIQGKTSLSLGQFRYETDGFRANNDFEQDIFNLFGQFVLTSRSNMQLELRRNEQESGDLRLRFDPRNFSNKRRESTDADSFRFGYHYSFSKKSRWMISGIYRNSETSLVDVETLNPVGPAGPIILTQDEKQDFETYNGELQYLKAGKGLRTTIGGGYYENEERSNILRQVTSGPILLGGLPPENINETEKHTNLYAYSTKVMTSYLMISMGISGDFYRSVDIKEDQFNPKLGVIVQPSPRTSLRLAAFRTFKRSLTSNQTLEPTQIAGFNQFFDDPSGTDATRYGLGLDYKRGSGFFSGLEFSLRELDIPVLDATSGGIKLIKQKEWFHRAYFYWTPFSKLALGTEYQVEKFDGDETSTNLDEPSKLTTHRIQLKARYFLSQGLFVKLKARFIKQKIQFEPSGLGMMVQDDDKFWVIDSQFGYWMPGRRGIISLSIHNVFDKKFKFYQSDFNSGLVSLPIVQPERTVYFRLFIFLD